MLHKVTLRLSWSLKITVKWNSCCSNACFNQELQIQLWSKILIGILDRQGPGGTQSSLAPPLGFLESVVPTCLLDQETAFLKVNWHLWLHIIWVPRCAQKLLLPKLSWFVEVVSMQVGCFCYGWQEAMWASSNVSHLNLADFMALICEMKWEEHLYSV